MGFSCVSIRDTSPGMHVPFDLSQSSCISQQIEAKGTTEKEETEQDKETDTGKLADHNDQEFGEEFDLELVDETEEKINDTCEVGHDQVFDQVSTVHDNINESRKENYSIEKNTTSNEIESDGLLTEHVLTETVSTRFENDKKKTTNGKRMKKKANPKSALKTTKLSKRFTSKSMLKCTGVGCKPVRRMNNGFGAKIVVHRKCETMPEKETPDVRDGLRYEVGMSDFCPLTSSNKSQTYYEVSHSTRKRKNKQSAHLLKQEVLQTLFKMHDEIQELLERRKQLYVGSPKCLTEPITTDKQYGIGIVQEE